MFDQSSILTSCFKYCLHITLIAYTNALIVMHVIILVLSQIVNPCLEDMLAEGLLAVRRILLLALAADIHVRDPMCPSH